MKPSRYLTLLTACCCCLILAWPKACPNDPFVNPNDPAAENDAYIPKPNGLMIEDFDDGKSLNLLGYCHEIFFDNSGPNSTNLAVVETSYVSQPKDVLRGVGRSWRIHFDVSKEPPPNKITLGGYVELLTGGNDCKRPNVGLFNLEVLNLNTLTFWVKGDDPKIKFEVALKQIGGCEEDTNFKDCQTTPKVLVSADTTWRKVKIPISALRPSQISGRNVNLKDLREINFSFYRNLFESLQPKASLTGTIYLDEIAFER